MVVVDPVTGDKSNFKSKKMIYEAFKDNNLIKLDNKNYYSGFIFDSIKKNEKKITKFY